MLYDLDARVFVSDASTIFTKFLRSPSSPTPKVSLMERWAPRTPSMNPNGRSTRGQVCLTIAWVWPISIALLAVPQPTARAVRAKSRYVFKIG